jgi:acyl transferase domain-containing protein/acyl carrier protein
MSRKTRNSIEDIAIVGMAGRFPGARNLAEFWHNLQSGRESITFFTEEEMRAAGTESALLQNPNWVNAGGVLDGIDLFDAGFFGFNPREAESLDPQQRLFMECAWEAIEDAGYDPERGEDLTGVYAGCAMSTYMFNLYRNPEFIAKVGYFQILIGNDKDYLATHAAYKLNLKGPAIGIQTACSTSLVAVALACQGLLTHQCDMALAGGVCIRVPQGTGYYYEPGGIYSPDGHCRAFDANGQGTVFGNGLGVVVLKRLQDALAAGDAIRAIIKSAAINNDGSLRVGYTAPGLDGQAEVVGTAHALAGIAPETITYVETHGTGTALGDPIEVVALTQAFRAGGAYGRQFCALGAVKSNIGHLDPAAGIAGLLKTVLALEHKTLPPSLHLAQPNQEIDFANSPFYVNASLASWDTIRLPRRAGVSAFGIGGTNAHVVLEEAPQLKPSAISRSSHLLLLSARTPAALAAASRQLAAHLHRHPDTNLADAAYTLQVGRKAFGHRSMVLCHDIAETVRALEALDPRKVLTAAPSPARKPIVFMFSGQGTQHVNMALGLYRGEPTFREHIQRCAEILKPHLGLDLRRLVYPTTRQAADAAEQLKQTALAQPALFVVEYALARLWMEWGVCPQAMIGHSIGEYVAACLAGVFSIEAALTLVARRGRLMQQLPTGAMLAVPLSEGDTHAFLNEKISLATINDAEMCVVAGPCKAIAELEARLTAAGLECRLLHTSHAFHSAMMDPILARFARHVRAAKPQQPQLPFVSNVTGTWITGDAATSPDYWAAHLRQPVRFADGLATLLAEKDCVLIEVGPGITLTTFARRHPAKSPDQLVLPSLRHPRELHDDVDFLLNKLGRLWLRGVLVDWRGFYTHEQRRRISLPTYPFERQRYWIDPACQPPTAAPPPATGKRSDTAQWLNTPTWHEAPQPPPSPAEEKTPWLVFADPGGLGERLAAQLAVRGCECVIVQAGARFDQSAPDRFAVDPGAADDYRALCRALRTAKKIPARIAHLWNVVEGRPCRSDEEFATAQDLGFYSLLFLAQAMGDEWPVTPVRLAAVSTNLQRLPGDAANSPEKATLLGPCKVIPQEYSHIVCRSIDLALPLSTDDVLDEITGLLLTEIASASEPIVAWRDGRRWVQKITPLQQTAPDVSRLRENGVYLITGGTGGIGLALAKYLAQTVRAKLVLIARSGLPARSEWPRLKSDPGEMGRRIREIESLEALGSEVLVFRADVANPAEMRAAVRGARTRFGAIHGVIHAAGVAGGGIIALKTREVADTVLRAKVQGSRSLNAVLADTELDFFVLCSSLASTVGGAGQVDYCAANAFLDALALAAPADGQRLVVSIGWDTWQEVGMAVNTPVPRELEPWRRAMLARGMTSREGTEVFARILAGAAPQVIVATTGLDYLATALAEPPPAMTTHPRPDFQTAFVAPRDGDEQAVAGIWEELLGTAPIGIHDDFFTELGGHSLLATQLVSRIRVKFDVELPLRRFFEAPTVADLAAAVRDLAGKGETASEPPLVALGRAALRAQIAADGTLQISDRLKRELLN